MCICVCIDIYLNILASLTATWGDLGIDPSSDPLREDLGYPVHTLLYLFAVVHAGRLPLTRAALTTHELEWLEHWDRLAELELKWSTREFVYVGNTSVTQSTLHTLI